MKKYSYIVLLLSMLSLLSCQRGGVNLFRGDYSYKISGSLTMEEIVNDTSVEPRIMHFRLDDEIGQMEISTLDKKENLVNVTMNTMGGSVHVTRGHIEGKTIVFDTFNRFITLKDNTIPAPLSCEVDVSGQGELFDNKTMLITLDYNGEYKFLNNTFIITDTDIVMVAQRNGK